MYVKIQLLETAGADMSVCLDINGAYVFFTNMPTQKTAADWIDFLRNSAEFGPFVLYEAGVNGVSSESVVFTVEDMTVQTPLANG